MLVFICVVLTLTIVAGNEAAAARASGAAGRIQEVTPGTYFVWVQQRRAPTATVIYTTTLLGAT